MYSSRSSRQKEGYALVSIIVSGMFAILFMLALAGMLLSLARSEAVTKQKSNLLEAAEIGLDYAIDDLNAAINTGNQSMFEVSDAAPEKTVSLPASYISGFANTTVKVKVRKLSDAERLIHSSFGVLYSPQMEPMEGLTTQFSDPRRAGINTDHGRVVEVSASRGLFHKSIRAVLEPRLDSPPTGGGNPSTTSSPLFPDAAVFAVTNLNMKPSTGSLDVVTSPTTDQGSNPEAFYNLKVQSNQQVSLDGQTNIKGDLIVSNNPGAAPNNIVGLGNNANIDGRLFTNNSSNTTVVDSPGSSLPSTGDNVDARADLDHGGAAREGLNLSTPVEFNSSNATPVEPNPVPTASISAVDTDADGTANTTNSLDAYLNTIDGGGATIDLTHGTTPGTSTEVNSFVTNQLDTSASGAKPINISNSNSQPTQIFVDGTNSTAAVTVDSSMFKNNTGDPLNLQIYYSGSSNVNINVDSGQDFSGLIYAPNADINVSGTGNFNGAVVGDRVNVNLNGDMNLVNGLGPSSNSGGGGGFVPSIDIDSSTGDIAIHGYRATTFQEVQSLLVP